MWKYKIEMTTGEASAILNRNRASLDGPACEVVTKVMKAYMEGAEYASIQFVVEQETDRLFSDGLSFKDAMSVIEKSGLNVAELEEVRRRYPFIFKGFAEHRGGEDRRRVKELTRDLAKQVTLATAIRFFEENDFSPRMRPICVDLEVAP